ncbi:sugar phosphate isomerase/epimerase [Utexia brackfieldae]|uniref:sugar phosphate isomerase/epimerase family protein n=1 Tax=Utexia brackfieldae TaxID=3074108 RepID=UPI00370DD6D1
MAERPIGLAALTVLDVSPANQVIVAAEAGYTHVGLRLIPATPTEPVYATVGNTPLIREVEQRLKETGIKVLDIEIFRLKPDTRVINFLPVLETGARLGANQVLLAGNDPEPSRLADNFAQLCDIAAPLGIAINIEPMPWTNVPNVKSAVELLTQSNQNNQGLIIDPLHFDRGANTLDDLKLVPKDCWRYMQLCDGTKEKPQDTEGLLYQARNYRLSPGRGGIDLISLLCALPEMPISIECCNDVLALHKSPIERAKMYIEDARALIRRVAESA